MVVLSAIYQIIIGPLELFFEVLFTVAYRFLKDPAMAIVFLSLAMNFLVLPLYRRADAMQEAERDRAAQMKPVVDHIKSTFKGDERFMMLQMYYRECNYKQTDALKGSVSLLLQIPFFIAAYHFLSNLDVLRGASLGPILDLGAPDALIQLGDVSINFLPILMTIINVVSATVYLRGFPISSKVQMYGIAAIFLVLLYASPAGLVFYWLLNNLFSLAKNIFYKLRRPGRVLAVIASASGIVLLVVACFVMSDASLKLRVIMASCALFLQVPIAISILRERSKIPPIPEATKMDDRAFLLGSIFLALFIGVLIPMSVIQASPSEFVDLTAFESPLWYVYNSFLLAFGTFVVWFGIFYRLATPRGRYLFGVVLLIACGVFLVNYFFFGTGYGNLSPNLQFDATPTNAPLDILINVLVDVLVAIALFALWKMRRSVVTFAYPALCLTAIVMFIVGAVQVNGALESTREAAAKMAEDSPSFTLSTKGKNVVVIMMDRAIPAYVPFIMTEHPEIEEQFDGFTCYINTLSYGSFTNIGSPGLYGGYEYIPEKMNQREDTPLVDKQNEALRVMPVLFDEAGYDVTVFDPTYAGYNVTPDLSIYDDYPDIDAYITMNGSYSVDEFSDADSLNASKMLRSRNFFCYGIFKVAPLFAQKALYNKGHYNSAQALSTSESKGGFTSPQARDGLLKARGVDQNFLESYSVLCSLPEMTEVTDSEAGGFLMMSNGATHEPMLLQEPNCTPAQVVDNTEFDSKEIVRYDAEGNVLDFTKDTEDITTSKRMHYQINVASWRELGNWFDYLRKLGVYDNTRIIIVSDHSRNLRLQEDLILRYQRAGNGEDMARDMQIFNCTLMVKDFGDSGFKVSDEFMTNADTPLLAMDGVVVNPVNPSTGNVLTDADKYEKDHYVQWPDEWSISTNNGNVFLPADWYRLTGSNVLDGSAWSYAGNY